MMASQPRAKGRQSAKGFQKNPLGEPTLAEAGIDKNLADRARSVPRPVSVRNENEVLCSLPLNTTDFTPPD
jgi:hypothetical protein